MTTKLSKLLGSLGVAGLTLGVPLGCKDEQTDKQAVEVKVLEPAINGSPITVEFVEFTGEGEDRGMNVLLYNTGDKPAVAYHLLFRYYDASDELLRVKPGTPFEDDTDFTSMSGNAFKCESKKNATLEIDPVIVSVPPNAARAEIFASSVRTLAADGVSIEDWWSQENFSEWPKK